MPTLRPFVLALKRMERPLYPFWMLLALAACSADEQRSDAYGNFEATTVTVSAEVPGKLLYLRAQEGQRLQAGQLVGLIDTTRLHLQKRELQARLSALTEKLQVAGPEIAVLEDQRANLRRERDRTRKLLAANAATQKQLDDLEGEIAVVEQQIARVTEQVAIANRSILSERAPLRAQIDLIDRQIADAHLYNPIPGRVLTRIMEPAEFVNVGSPIYRLASLDTLTLRAYAGAPQMEQAALGQRVQVRIDDGKTGYQSLSGQISWIAEEAEFTPKIIQTKEERVNLVYALEVKVPNPSGKLRIGMPAEVNFTQGGGQSGSDTVAAQ